MKNLRNLMTAVTLMVVLAAGTISANAGVLLSDRSVNTDCTPEVKYDMGIIIAGLTGIIIAGRDGIIIAGRDGIIIAGKSGSGCQSRDGILLHD